MIQIKEGQLEVAHLQRLGEEWIQSITDRAVERLEGFCVPDVSFQFLTPKRYVTLENAADLVARFRQWFGKCTDFQIQTSRIELVGERLGIFYRLLLQEDGIWYNIEQQLFCTLQAGHITQLHLLCSGFQPVSENHEDTSEASAEGFTHDGLLEFYSNSSVVDSTCAVLTPMIRAKLREMQSGQILEVRVDDPTARGDIESWSRLSGNELLKVIEDGTHVLRCFVKKK
jgi:TusA-related sulfurtransferase